MEQELKQAKLNKRYNYGILKSSMIVDGNRINWDSLVPSDKPATKEIRKLVRDFSKTQFVSFKELKLEIGLLKEKVKGIVDDVATCDMVDIYFEKFVENVRTK